MKRIAAVLALGLAVACGDSGHTVTARLTRSVAAGLDPGAAEVGLTKIRVLVDGPEANDDAVIDLAADGDVAVFEHYPTTQSVDVQALGFDAQGNIVAFGRVDRVSVTEDVDLTFALRRNLAYVIHAANAGQARPESQVYQIDLATRGYVSKVRLPGTAPVARSITARGGSELLVTYDDGTQGGVALLSAEDHSIETIMLPRPQDMTLGSAASPLGVALGGGQITFLDLDQRTVLGQFERPVGGRVLDGVISADGRTALVVISAAPGLLQINLQAQTVESVNVIPDPGGVALARDGRVAYVTSSTDRVVAAVDLENGRTQVLNGFVKPVGLAAYADELEAVLALDVSEDNGVGRVLGFIAPADEALRVDEGVKTLSFPTGIASDGAGRRALVVAAGTSTDTAGLTMIETTATALPIGASALYPTDPDDRYLVGPLDLGQRYQPSGVAIVYGR